MNRLETVKLNSLTVFVCVCFCAVSIVISLSTAIILSGATRPASMVLYLLLSLLFVALIILLTKFGTRRQLFGLGLFLAALLLKGTFALTIDTQPQSDFFLLYSAAQNLAQGINTMTDSQYFIAWPYQSAFVAWMALFIKLFGANITFFKLMNCLFSALTTFLIYQFARRFASERGARAAGILHLIYPGTFVMVSVLTNQHLSDFLMLAALFVFTSFVRSTGKQLCYSGMAAVLLMLSNCIRPTGIVVVAAVIVYVAVQVLVMLWKKQSGARQLLLRAAVLLVVYFAACAGMSELVKITGLNEYGLTNNVPGWKFVVGLNEESNGVYNEEDDLAVFDEGVDSQAVAQEIFEERKSMGILRFAKLAMKKMLLLWGDFEPSYWAFTDNVYEDFGGEMYIGPWLLRAEKITSGMYFWIYILIALGVIMPLKKKQLNECVCLLMLVALAFFCAHLLIEVQVRYRSTMTVVTFPLIALGVDSAYCMFMRFRETHHRSSAKTLATSVLPLSFVHQTMNSKSLFFGRRRILR